MNQHPAIQSLMDGVKTGGWEGLENFGKNAKEAAVRMREQAEREARIVQETFSTPSGQQCLEWLIKMTLLRGPNQEELAATTAEAFAIANARRQGQDQIVFTILQALSFKEQQG
jgi:hypothetical protein